VKHGLVAGLLLVALAAAASAEAPAVSRESLRTASGVSMDMVYGSLEPGQPLLFILKSPEVAAAIVHFRGQTAVIRRDGTAAGAEPMAFLGIDLDVRPGTYPVEVQFERTGGTIEAFHGGITVRPKNFSSIKLRVSPEFVTPPRSVQERIRRESEMVNLVLSLTTPEWLGDGPFMAPHPVQPWPNFGQRRVTNGILSSVHGGVDLPVPFGQPIRATNRGRVVLASPLYLSGGTVIIDHGLGVFSYYCHLSKLLVRRGNVVAKGGVIGACGSSGRSTGPHLHWSMRIGPSRVDPYAFLALPIEGGNVPRDGR